MNAVDILMPAADAVDARAFLALANRQDAPQSLGKKQPLSALAQPLTQLNDDTKAPAHTPMSTMPAAHMGGLSHNACPTYNTSALKRTDSLPSIASPNPPSLLTLPNIDEEAVISSPPRPPSSRHQQGEGCITTFLKDDQAHTPQYVDPSWPRVLIKMPFQDKMCGHHPSDPKNRLAFFCLKCGPVTGMTMCKDCRLEHDAECKGPVKQVYRYMHHDILRVSAFKDLIDLEGIQQYSANEHPAVHLRPREKCKSKPPATHTKPCAGRCGRQLKDTWTYCSLACKLAHFEDTPCGVLLPVENDGWDVGSQSDVGGGFMAKTHLTACDRQRKYESHLSLLKVHKVLRKTLQGAARRKARSPERSCFC